MHITMEEALQALQDDLVSTKSAVEDATKTKSSSDDQFAAMVSLCFNIGSANFRSSTVLREHLAGNTTAAANAFLMWNKTRVNGVLQPLPGLISRRTAERALYLA